MNLAAIKESVKEMDPQLNTECDDFKVAVILLSILEVGPNESKLYQFTGYPFPKICIYLARLKKNGIIDDKYLYINWGDKDGAVAFWCDVLVATGKLEKTYDKKDKKDKEVRKKRFDKTQRELREMLSNNKGHNKHIMVETGLKPGLCYRCQILRHIEIERDEILQ